MSWLLDCLKPSTITVLQAQISLYVTKKVLNMGKCGATMAAAEAAVTPATSTELVARIPRRTCSSVNPPSTPSCWDPCCCPGGFCARWEQTWRQWWAGRAGRRRHRWWCCSCPSSRLWRGSCRADRQKCRRCWFWMRRSRLQVCGSSSPVVCCSPAVLVSCHTWG